MAQLDSIQSQIDYETGESNLEVLVEEVFFDNKQKQKETKTRREIIVEKPVDRKESLAEQVWHFNVSKGDAALDFKRGFILSYFKQQLNKTNVSCENCCKDTRRLNY